METGASVFLLLGARRNVSNAARGAKGWKSAVQNRAFVL